MNYKILLMDIRKDKFEEKVFKDMTLEQALREASRKGQIFEVTQVDSDGNFIVEVEWQHLYHF